MLDSNLFIADVTTPGLLEAAMEGMDAVVLCTSAVPKVLDGCGLGSKPRGRGGLIFRDRYVSLAFSSS